MSPVGSRRRAGLFGLLAFGCALASIAIAARYREATEPDFGPERPVVVLERGLEAGEKIEGPGSRRGMAVRAVPERFVPPDALRDPAEAVGSTPRAAVPAGSYLLTSHLQRGSGRRTPQLPDGLRPIQVEVAGGAALAGIAGGPGAGGAPRVDVIAADEPGSTFNPRVRVLARRVPLLGLDPAGGRGDASGRAWQATLALSRTDALEVIEAENFSREVRLLPRGGPA